jgi:hypothetical protein
VAQIKRARWGGMAEEDASFETGSSEPGPAENHRDRQIWWTLAAVGLVLFIAIVMLGRPLVSGRLTAARNLDRATAMVLGTNVQFVAIDSAVRASSTMTSAGAEEALATVRATRRTLEEASPLSQNGYGRLTEAEQKRATLVKAMAVARLEALVAAETALSNGGAVKEQALREYDRAAEKVRQADAALVKL